MTDPMLPAEKPVTESDAEIAAALESASIPALLLSMIHMSGDTAILDGDIKPNMAVLGEIQGFLTPEQQAEVRAQALPIIAAYRDRGCTLPPAPDRETLHRMMAFIVGDEVPPEYIDFTIEETNLYGDDRRAFRWDKDVPGARKQAFKTLVVGAGQSGVLAGIRLNEAGLPFDIVEKNSGIGGTWWENSYPGARVDVDSHFYSYSFEPNNDWPEHYSQQAELAAYFDRCAQKYGVKDHIEFETEMVSARFDETAGLWDVTLRKSDGSSESRRYNAIISGVGQLNRPKMPDIKGADTFTGPAFHSSHWDHSIDLKGKTVAVIGTGASAFQLVPEIAKTAGHVTVYQRSPNWCFPNERYHDAVSDGKIWLLKHLPFYARWYRFLHFWMMSDKTLPILFVDPEWPDKSRSINEMNEITRVMFTDYMEAQCGEDEQLRRQVIPTYPPLGKRTLQDNGSWINALKRDNVTLVTEAVTELTESSVIDATGSAREADIVIYATGFHASRFLWPMDIRGRDNVSLEDWWGDDPQTHLGITTPKFPNLFCMYGPGNNLGHGGSLIFYSECQIRLIMDCIKQVIEQDAATIECTEAAAKAYHKQYSDIIKTTVWAQEGVDNWYKNAAGKVTTTSPWRLVDFWDWTRNPDPENFIIR